MSDYVIVSCACPGGLVLQLADGSSVTLNGAGRTLLGTDLNLGFGNTGAGLTAIDAGVWSSWLSDNQNSPFLALGVLTTPAINRPAVSALAGNGGLGANLTTG